MRFYKGFRIFFTLILILACITLLTGASFLYKNLHYKNFENKDPSSVAGGVTPHHLLAKDIIENFFKTLKENDLSFSKNRSIFIFSSDHFSQCSIQKSKFLSTLSDKFEEKYTAPLDKNTIKKLLKLNLLALNNYSVLKEHGITELIPFIKKYYPKAKIIPVIISPFADENDLKKLIDTILTISCNSLVIASVDFTHYLDETGCIFHDIKSVRVLDNFEEENFREVDVDSWQSLYALRYFAFLKGASVVLRVANSTSFEISRSFKNISGFEFSQNPLDGTSYYSAIFLKNKKVISKDTQKSYTLLLLPDISNLKSNSFVETKEFERLKKGVDFVCNFDEIKKCIQEKFNFPALDLLTVKTLANHLESLNIKIDSLQNISIFKNDNKSKGGLLLIGFEISKTEIKKIFLFPLIFKENTLSLPEGEIKKKILENYSLKIKGQRIKIESSIINLD